MKRLGWSLIFLLCWLPLRALAADLPDFTALVARHGMAVVNISALTDGREPTAAIPQLHEDDPMFDFFRRFFPRPPGVPQNPDDNRSLGSGFIISPDGYILTNAHVIENAEEIIVRLVDKREFNAKVIGADKRSDIALIKIEASGLPRLEMGNPQQLQVGEWVVAIGSPFGFDHSVTAGIVSAKGRTLPQENFVPFIQTDVAINPGNSGGPLFNLRGEVVGINSQIYSRTGGFMGLSFAIPIDVAMAVQAQLREHGRVQRGRIGVTIQEVTRELATAFALPAVRGALVSAVERGSPAERAGIQQGDVIVRFDQKTIEESGDLPRVVGDTRPGYRAEVEVLRAGAPQKLAVVVGELREEGSPVRAVQPLSHSPNRFGLVLREPSPRERRELALDHGLMVEVARGPAARAELQTGDIVLALVSAGQQQPLRALAQFDQSVSAVGKGQSVSLLVRRGDVTSYVSVRAER